jgi:hypothetical protein
MVHREVRRQLLGKLGISKQALSLRANRLKNKHGPMSTDDAVYVIAHMTGIDLSNYLPPETLDRLRSLIPRPLTRPVIASQQAKGKSHKKKQQPVTYPLVEDAVMRAAFDLGAEVFPLVFVLENSIRNLIEKRLSKFGSHWWDTRVPSDVKRNVQRTIERERMFTYREARGDQPLLYANFADLKKIILEDANRSSFADVIKDFDLLRAKMDEVYMARNNLAHSVALSRNDVARITLFYGDWARQLEAVSEK